MITIPIPALVLISLLVFCVIILLIIVINMAHKRANKLEEDWSYLDSTYHHCLEEIAILRAQNHLLSALVSKFYTLPNNDGGKNATT